MKPRTSALDRRTAMRLAATEYGRCGVLMQSLDRDSWSEPTICPQWDVRQMAAHMLGMVEMAASIREGGRQRRAATVGGDLDIDRLTATLGIEQTQAIDANANSWFGQHHLTPAFVHTKGGRKKFFSEAPRPDLADLLHAGLTYSNPAS